MTDDVLGTADVARLMGCSQRQAERYMAQWHSEGREGVYRLPGSDRAHWRMSKHALRRTFPECADRLDYLELKRELEG